MATALRTKREMINGWETGRATPRPPRLAAYKRLLDGWAAKYPAPVPATFTTTTTAPTPAPAPTAVPAPAVPAAAADARPTPSTRSTPARPTSTSRRPAAKKATPAVVDPRFPHGPLGVLDGDGSVECGGGVVLQCPATTIWALVEWTLAEPGIGQARLHRDGKDSDPLIVLTESAADRFAPYGPAGEARRNAARCV
ncbi:hypothetical protein [Streptomyces sp. MK5]|uniref:hypothetical protein n=1 Tax=Streptomyces sp. MK5 TaxID=3064253 RepID=UPI00274261BA|nr:hypothetical protein [Streptomyces sp. MK5]